MGFAEDIEAFREKALLDMNKSVSGLVKKLTNSVISETPSKANPGKWARGHLVNQWYPAINSFDSSRSNTIDDVGSESYLRVGAMLEKKPFYGKDAMFTFTNSVDYVWKAEHDGWDFTKPYKMVGLSVQQIKQDYT